MVFRRELNSNFLTNSNSHFIVFLFAQVPVCAVSCGTKKYLSIFFFFIALRRHACGDTPFGEALFVSRLRGRPQKSGSWTYEEAVHRGACGHGVRRISSNFGAKSRGNQLSLFFFFLIFLSCKSSKTSPQVAADPSRAPIKRLLAESLRTRAHMRSTVSCTHTVRECLPSDEGDDSDPRLASRRDCVLTAKASRPEAAGWAPLV